LMWDSLPANIVGDVRHSLMERTTLMTRTVAAQAGADISDNVESRNPQQHDLAEQQLGSRAVSALYDTFGQRPEEQIQQASASSASRASRSPLGRGMQEQDQQASASSSSRRVRSPPSRGVHEQSRLSLGEMTSLYGIGSCIVMAMGWQNNTHLGRDRGHSSGLIAALTDDSSAGDRSGIGFSNRSHDDDSIRSGVLAASPNPAGQVEVNQEAWPICLQELGRDDVVEYRCGHSFHSACDNGLVASVVEAEEGPSHATCPVCREPRVVVVMEITPRPEQEVGPPRFQEQVAIGSPAVCGGVQLHSRSPRFAVPSKP